MHLNRFEGSSRAPRPSNAAATRPDPSSTGLTMQEAGTRVSVEVFDGQRFIDASHASLFGFASHAEDICELMDRAWLGYPRSALSRAPTVVSSDADVPAPPPRRPPRRREQTPRKSLLPWNWLQTDLGPGAPVPGAPLRGPPPPSPAIVTPERQAQILQELPGIGTWAGRQRLFSVRPGPTAPWEANGQPPPLQVATSPSASLPAHSPSSEEILAAAAEQTVHGGLLNGYAEPNEPSDSQEIASEAAAAAGAAAGAEEETRVGHCAAAMPRAPAVLERSASNASSEARHMHEAWRWRFSRKWEAEQRRGTEGGPPVDAGSLEGDFDALEYLQACGMGTDLQILEARRRGRARGRSSFSRHRANGPPSCRASEPRPAAGTPSSALLRRNGSSVSTVTMQFDVDASYVSGGSLLIGEDSGSLLGHSLLSPDPYTASNPTTATRDLLTVAVRGRELLQRQKELESEAAAQWERIERAASGAAWVGGLLAPVDIDMSGRFPLAVLRVSEPGTARQRFLVRGRRGATPGELLEEAVAHVAALCSEQGLPYASVSLVGTGICEWRSDTDRHVLLLPPTPSTGGGAVPASVGASLAGHGGSPPCEAPGGDVSGLAASLLRQTLPPHFVVTHKPKNGTSMHNGTLKI